MIAVHNIKSIEFRNDSMILEIDDKKMEFLLDMVSPKLKAASDIERSFYKVSPSGYGIHWALIDEDLSIEGLLNSPTRPDM
jgi:hypothetical protein